MRRHRCLVPRHVSVLPVAILAVLLAACSGDNPADGDAGAVGPAGQGIAAPAPGSRTPGAGSNGRIAPAPAAMPQAVTAAGDGSDIELSALSAGDIDGAALAGELACSFSAPGSPPLLLATGDVASTNPSRGVVKVGRDVVPVSAPGGFDAMLADVRFSGGGRTVRIEVTGPATADGESPPRPATLTYARGDGSTRSYTGQWQCGP